MMQQGNGIVNDIDVTEVKNKTMPKSWICPHCKNKIPEESVFCPKCGGKLSE